MAFCPTAFPSWQSTSSEGARDALIHLSSRENGLVISRVQGVFANALSVKYGFVARITNHCCAARPYARGHRAGKRGLKKHFSYLASMNGDVCDRHFKI